MRSTSLKHALVLGCLLFLAAPCLAQRMFDDVPRDHPAYECLFAWARDTGIPVGYPDGTFGGKRLMTRYEFAVVIARLMPELEKRENAGWVTTPPMRILARRDFACLRHAAATFRPEMDMLKIDMPALFRDLDRYESSYFAAAARGPYFGDVPRDHWAYGSVQYLAARGLVVGYPEKPKE